MDSRLRRFALGVVVVMVAALAAWQGAAQERAQPKNPATPDPAAPPVQPDPNQPRPTFRTGINFVRVDVIVSDRDGNAVANLQQGDFEVTEDGRPQTIETFKLVRLDGTPGPDDPRPKAIRTDYDEQSEAARDDVRLFAIFLDDYHGRRASSVSVRDPLVRFLDSLGPSDLVGVMHPLSPVSAVRFTRDRAALMSAIQRFEGRKYDYIPRNQFEERYAHYPTEVVERVRNQVSLSALEALAMHMGSLKEGRKALLLVSEGYSDTVPPQMRDQVSTAPGFGNPNFNNPTAGENDRNEDSARFFGNIDMEQRLREVYNAANRNNTAIYSVDPRGLAAYGFDIDQNIGPQTDRIYLNASIDTLRRLSENSDGRAIVSRNDLATAMTQIVRDSSAYYLLGYNSSRAPQDGKYHEIKVRVKRPSGVQVRARKGYWALTPDDVSRALAPPKPALPKPIERALATATVTNRGQVIRTWVGTSRGENGKTRVTFVWEPVPIPLGDRTRRAEPARVAVVASGAGISPYFRGRVPDVALASTTPPAAESSGSTPRVSSRVVFEAEPGRLQLRLAVEGPAAEVLDSEVQELSVPDLTGTQTTIGTPEVFRARNAREYRTLSADADAVPVATREFLRSDRLLIRFDAYGPAQSTPAVAARLLNRAGQPMVDLPVTAGGTPGGRNLIDLPLASLAAGEYLVEVKASGEGGEAKEVVGIRVIG